jgi:DNA invertase Pin-like site-specific DNA recombinase
MKVFYSRVSTIEQNESRQLQNVDDFDLVLIDKESGLTPLFERKEGSKILELMNKSKLTHLEVHSIDRLGRDTLSVLSVWKEFTEKGVRVVCRNPNFQNLNDKGEKDYFSELLLNILSTMSSFEKSLIKSRQMEGIKMAQMRGVYKNRKKRGKEGTMKFLEKHSQAIKYLEMGMKGVEVSKLCDISQKTVVKIKKMVQPTLESVG